jgi:hypothetical protein
MEKVVKAEMLRNRYNFKKYFKADQKGLIWIINKKEFVLFYRIRNVLLKF